MTTITRRFHFSASHRLHIADWTEARNSELYGKCNNPYGHGHDYILEVTVTGPVDLQTGVLLPLSELDGLVEEAVLREFRNCNFNSDMREFQTLVPTTENIAAVIVQRIEACWAKCIQSPDVR